MSKKRVKFDVRYVSDVPFGGEIVRAGTSIGQIDLPEACNPIKVSDHFVRGLLQLVDVDAEKAQLAAAEKAEAAAEAKKTAAEAKKTVSGGS